MSATTPETVRADMVRPGDVVHGVARAWGGATPYRMLVQYAGAERYATILRDGSERIDVDPTRVELFGFDVDDGRPCRMTSTPHGDVDLVAPGQYHEMFTREDA